MNVEYLQEGSEDCPLVRLFEFTLEEIVNLRAACRQLHDGTIDRFELSAQPWVKSVGGFQLSFGIAKWNRGLVEERDGTFSWLLRRATWDNVEGLLEPFEQSPSFGFQWLDDSGGTSLLLSESGCW